MQKEMLVYPMIIDSIPDQKHQYAISIPDLKIKTKLMEPSINAVMLSATELVGSLLMNDTSYPMPTPLDQIKVVDPKIKTLLMIDLTQYRQVNANLVPIELQVPEYLVKMAMDANLDLGTLLTNQLNRLLMKDGYQI